MPEPFTSRSNPHAGVCSAVLFLAFLTACQSNAQRESAALKQDTQALAQLSQIDNSINTSSSISREHFLVLKSIREKYSSSPEVRQIYKDALVMREDWAALEDFLQEVPMAELSPENRHMLGKLYVKRGKYEQAIETLKPLADKDPNSVETHSLVGLSYFYLGRLDEAGAQLDGVWDRIIADKLGEEVTTRGTIYLRQNDLQNAVRVLKQAVEIAPDSAAANNALSQAYVRSGNSEEAENYRLRTVAINDRMAAKTLQASRRVQQIYELESAWNAKRYQTVIDLAREILQNATERDQLIALYQYLFESHKALGNEKGANEALAAAQKLQQQK